MKHLLALILILTPLVASADKKPSKPFPFERISGDWGIGFDVAHYCHMGAVYAVLFERSRGEGPRGHQVRSSTIVWDVENNRPYRCDEFEQRQGELMEDYEAELETYYENNPRVKLRPNQHTRP